MNPQTLTVQPWGDVQNVGFGPALDVKLTISFPTGETGLGTWAAGERLHLSNNNTEGNIKANILLTPPDVKDLLKESDALVRVDWRTIFNHFGFCEYHSVDGAFILKTLMTPED